MKKDDSKQIEDENGKKMQNPLVLLLCIAEYDYYDNLDVIKDDFERYRQLWYVSAHI